MPEEHKIIVTGTMGAGKTTAIGAVSTGRRVSTEVANTDRSTIAKATTTVGLDYGEVLLEDQSVLRLYGTPGQSRFSFMWKILARGALGLVVLVDNSRPQPLEDLGVYLESFAGLVASGVAVVGVGRTETHPEPSIEAYQRYLEERGLALPVLAVDVRRREDVLMLLDVLFGLLEVSGAATEADGDVRS
jgi:uncharacterized protein